MKYIALALMVAIAPIAVAANVAPPAVSLPLHKTGHTQRNIGRDLILSVDGGPEYFQVSVSGPKRSRYCYDNMVYATAHGPGP